MATDRTRARDVDRDAAVEVVEAAYADGQLDAAERDRRVGVILQAVMLRDVRGMVGDLQGVPTELRPPVPPRPAHAVVRSPKTSRVGIAVALGALVLVLLLAALAAWLETVLQG